MKAEISFRVVDVPGQLPEPTFSYAAPDQCANGNESDSDHHQPFANLRHSVEFKRSCSPRKLGFARACVRSESQGPNAVASAIARAIEDPAAPLRVPVGQDAEMILGLRRSLDDQAFEDAMRKAVGLSW
jgi:hypothetical protein